MKNQSHRQNAAASPSRRTILKSAAATATLWSAGVAPAFLYAQDRSGSREVVIGEGDYQYRCIHDWAMGNLPDGHGYGGASHGTAIDSQGFIYITHYGNPGSIFVFDPDGKFVRAMGDLHRVGNRGGGHGIDIREENGEEFIYLSPSETALSFAKINLEGEVLWQRGRNELQQDTGLYEGDAAYRPTNISFSPDGGYFLGEGYGSSYIHQYDKDDKYVRTIGGQGTEDGKFQTPHGQWLDDRDGTPKLVVCDRANERLQWFDMDGNHLKTLGGFLFPADIDIRNDLMLVPDLHCRVTLLDKDNNVLTHLGDDPEWRTTALEGFQMRGQRENWKPGKFIHPHDACFDHEGNIYIAEWVVTGRVTKLERIS